jgi:fatty-acyl-CoA synthase
MFQYRGEPDRVTLPRLVRQLPSLARDAGTIIRGGCHLLTLRPGTRDSVGHVFQRLAARYPNRAFLRAGTGEFTYAQANAQVNRYASVLADYGVRPGSRVGVLATNRPETLFVALAVVKLGAAAGMLNHHQRGDVLDHSQRALDSEVLVVGVECRAAWESLPPDGIRGTVLGLPDSQNELPGYPDLAAAASTADPGDPGQCPEIRAEATAFYVFTSGTTGRPKASGMSHLRWLKSMAGFGRIGARIRPSDTLYCCLPLYHNNALTVSLSSVLSVGATFALGTSFSTSRFWDDVIRADATAFTYVGEICRYLLNQPHSAAERAHRIRTIVGNGMRPEIWSRFQDRFGISRVTEFYGSSECNLAFLNVFNLDRTAGACHLPFAVVNHDSEAAQPLRDARHRACRVRIGEVGLLLAKVTVRAPFDGYLDRDATERKLVRDVFHTGDTWFNTGDLVQRQGWRHIAFVDRLGDTFRWKGENVAASEVEAMLGAHPDIEQAVVYGVSVPGADGKAGMAAIRLRPDTGFRGADIGAHLTHHLPGYAVPLFVRVVEWFPQTSTFKYVKTELQASGYDSRSIDDPIYVLADREIGYVQYYPAYPDDVASGMIRI